jgi:hypothetical protein
MSEKVVLPKFDLPGDRTHPAVKVLMGAGALLLLCIAGLGMVLWQRHSQLMAAEARQQAIETARIAEANAKVEAAKAREAEAVARVEQAKIEAAAKAAAAKAAPIAAAAPGADPGAAPAHHAHHHGPSKGSKPIAKADDKDKKATPKPAGEKRDDAAIDKLLASFKK